MLRDHIRVGDAGRARVFTSAGDMLAERTWGLGEKSCVEVEGWVDLVVRERGKLVSSKCRSSKNIWTITGREYLAMLMSIETAGSPGVAHRADSVAYLGVGTGSQTEDASVSALVTPVAYASGLFLAALDIPPTFPLTPTRTTVQYRRLFAENEITLTSPTQVDVGEIGLFTNGHQTTFTAGGRVLTLAAAGQQSPVAYKSFEPFGKTSSNTLEVTWRIFF